MGEKKFGEPKFFQKILGGGPKCVSKMRFLDPLECASGVHVNFTSLSKEWSNYDVRSTISCQVMITHIDFAVTVTFHVQTLILDLMDYL